MKRDGIGKEIIDLIMDSQKDESAKAEKADFVIVNDGSIDELRAAVDKELKKL